MPITSSSGKGCFATLHPSFDYEYMFNTKVDHHKDDQVRQVPPGSEGSSNLGLGGALVYDNRHNVLNVRKGFFAEAGLLN
jgi:hypothetical protein